MRANTRAERIVRNRKIMLSIAVLSSIIVAMTFGGIKAKADTTREIYSYCTSYEVQPGDTLWTIADKFTGPDYTDKQTFIKNVKSMNHLLSDDITAGKYLVIEYYSYDEL